VKNPVQPLKALTGEQGLLSGRWIEYYDFFAQIAGHSPEICKHPDGRVVEGHGESQIDGEWWENGASPLPASPLLRWRV